MIEKFATGGYVSMDTLYALNERGLRASGNIIDDSFSYYEKEHKQLIDSINKNIEFYNEVLLKDYFEELKRRLDFCGITLMNEQGEFRDTIDVMNDVGAVWNKLSKKDQDYLNEIFSFTCYKEKKEEEIIDKLIKAMEEIAREGVNKWL